MALGRTYFVDGRVATGRRLGRKMGFPTVNVDPANELFPDGGVFVTTCRFESFDRSFESVTNIGVRPTLYENYATHDREPHPRLRLERLRRHRAPLLPRAPAPRAAVPLRAGADEPDPPGHRALADVLSEASRA